MQRTSCPQNIAECLILVLEHVLNYCPLFPFPGILVPPAEQVAIISPPVRQFVTTSGARLLVRYIEILV